MVDDPGTTSDKRLEAPPVFVTSATAQVMFRNYYSTESTFDGAVLEVSVGGGIFTDIIQAGGSFVTGGYNATIDTAFGSPIAGRQAWTGDSGNYITTVANLGPAAAGQTVVLRFRMASDSSVSGNGWFVDTISLTDGCPSPTATPTATATPSGTPMPTTTPTPGASPTPTPSPSSTPIPSPTPMPNTLPGTNVTVLSPSGDESVTFAEVTAAGFTSFTQINPFSFMLPPGYKFDSRSRGYDISTTAEWNVAAGFKIGFSYNFDNISPGIFGTYSMLHGEDGVLVDRTDERDFGRKVIFGLAYRFSPFLVAPSTAAPNRLLNISTRLRVETGDNVLIGGLIVTGNDPKRVILRGIGPSLAGTGVPDALQDTTLQLYQGGTLLAENDNWKDTQQAEIEATGISPANDLESAIVRTLSPGAYTAILRGKDNTTGIGLVEGYDLSPAADAKLANISTRGFVATGDNVLIGGFIVGSTSSTSAAVVVRAIGPSLSGAGIAGALQDPTLDLYNGSGTIVASNDNWRETQQAEIEAAGIPPSDDRESAIVATLASGPYTAIVRGKDNTTGVAVVEVYNLQ